MDIDSVPFLTNAHIPVESLLHNLEQAANLDKIELIYFKQVRAITTLIGKTLKLVNQFIYVGSNISFIESDAYTHIGKVWNVIDWLSNTWKSDLHDKTKYDSFQTVAVTVLQYGCTHCKRKIDGNYTNMLRAVLNKSWRQHPIK